jgi:hypothetical protein
VCSECFGAVAGAPLGLCLPCQQREVERLRAIALRPWQWAVLGTEVLIPLVVGTVLAAMRPDLMGPMFAHFFGFGLAAGLLLLIGAQAALLYFGMRGANRNEVKLGTSSAARSAILGAVGLFFCSAPSVFLLLFGPIIFRFMFAELPPQ